MKFFAIVVLLIVFGLLAPTQAYASSSDPCTGTSNPDIARDWPGRLRCGRAHPSAQRQVEARLTLIQHLHSGGIVMNLLKSPAFLMGLLVTGVLLPFQANASGPRWRSRASEFGVARCRCCRSRRRGMDSPT